MKTAISVPDNIFEAAEQLAKRLGVSRSQLYTKAISSYVREHQNAGITEALDSVYGPGGEESKLDPEIIKLQSRSLSKEVW